MAEYRVPEFTLEQRTDVAVQMMIPLPEQRWGLVSELARRHSVSRTILYKIRDRGLGGLARALLPRDPGRPAQTSTLTVDKPLIDRTIAVLPMLKGSVRDIRMGLDLILGVSRSVGYISQTLATAGEQATAYNLRITVPLPILGEADEIFQGRKPCLTLVDGRSFLVLSLTPAESRDGTTWGVTYLDLVVGSSEQQDPVYPHQPGDVGSRPALGRSGLDGRNLGRGGGNRPKDPGLLGNSRGSPNPRLAEEPAGGAG